MKFSLWHNERPLVERGWRNFYKLIFTVWISSSIIISFAAFEMAKQFNWLAKPAPDFTYATVVMIPLGFVLNWITTSIWFYYGFLLEVN